MRRTLAQIAGITTPQRYREGGHVRGPGTSTSDSIPARLSDGEFVLPTDTVRKVGVRRLQDLVDSTHKYVGRYRPGQFANGGMVDDEVTRVGNSYIGGNVGGNVSINGQTGGRDGQHNFLDFPSPRTSPYAGSNGSTDRAAACGRTRYDGRNTRARPSTCGTHGLGRAQRPAQHSGHGQLHHGQPGAPRSSVCSGPCAATTSSGNGTAATGGRLAWRSPAYCPVVALHDAATALCKRWAGQGGRTPWRWRGVRSVPTTHG